MRYTVIGLDDEDLSLRRLLFYDPMVGTKSERCEDLRCAKDFAFDSLDDAVDLADRLLQMDQVFWPQFNPVVAELADGLVATLLAPGAMEAGIAEAAKRAGVAARAIPLL